MKLTALTTALIVTGFSSLASAGIPPKAPDIYDSGPASPAIFSTNMTAAERAAFALMEAVMQITEAKIHATSCGSTTGSYPVALFANGLLASNGDEDNTVTVSSINGQFELDADLRNPVDFRGQKIDIAQDPAIGKFDGTAVQNYEGVATYNEVNNMLFQWGRVDVKGARGNFDRYQGKVIKDFYQGSLNAGRYEILDWGLQSLHKHGYPVHKYWQRSKAERSNGSAAFTRFVKDRLVGPTSCRISIHLTGFNEEDFVSQTGNLTVSTTTPVTGFNQD